MGNMVSRRGAPEESRKRGREPTSAPASEERRKRRREEYNGPPAFYVCPITREVMNDPVILLTEASGQSFERRALERWLRRHPRRDPLTNETHAQNLTTAPNRALKEAIAEWRLREGLEQPVEDAEDYTDVSSVSAHATILRDASATVTQRIEAAGAIAEYCAHDDPDRYDEAREAGCIPLLVNMLTGPEASATAAAFALGCVSQSSTENRTAIRQAGGVAPLVALVGRGRAVARVFASGLLASLACHEASRADIVANDGVGALVRVLADDDDDSVVPAACALYNLTNDREEGPREAVLNAGAVAILVRYLERRNSDDDQDGEGVVPAGAANEEETNQQPRRTNDIEMAVSTRGSTVISVPWTRSEEDADEADPAARNMPNLRVAHRRAAQANDEVQDCAVGVLLHLSSRDDNDVAKVAILEANGYAVLVDVVRRNATATDSVMGRALAALAKTAEAEDTRFLKAIVDAGGAEVLASFLRAATSQTTWGPDARRICDHGRFQAVIVLFRLVCDGGDEFIQALLDANCVKALVDVVRPPHSATNNHRTRTATTEGRTAANGDDDMTPAAHGGGLPQHALTQELVYDALYTIENLSNDAFPASLDEVVDQDHIDEDGAGQRAVDGATAMATLTLHQLGGGDCDCIRRSIVEAGGIEAFADVFVRSSADSAGSAFGRRLGDTPSRTRVHEVSAGLLCLLSKIDHERTARALLRSDAVPSVLRLLEADGTPVSAKFRTAELLRCVICVPALKRSVRDSDGVAALCKFVHAATHDGSLVSEEQQQQQRNIDNSEENETDFCVMCLGSAAEALTSLVFHKDFVRHFDCAMNGNFVSFLVSKGVLEEKGISFNRLSGGGKNRRFWAPETKKDEGLRALVALAGFRTDLAMRCFAAMMMADIIDEDKEGGLEGDLKAFIPCLVGFLDTTPAAAKVPTSPEDTAVLKEHVHLYVCHALRSFAEKDDDLKLVIAQNAGIVALVSLLSDSGTTIGVLRAAVDVLLCVARGPHPSKVYLYNEKTIERLAKLYVRNDPDLAKQDLALCDAIATTLEALCDDKPAIADSVLANADVNLTMRLAAGRGDLANKAKAALPRAIRKLVD